MATLCCALIVAVPYARGWPRFEDFVTLTDMELQVLGVLMTWLLVKLTPNGKGEKKPATSAG